MKVLILGSKGNLGSQLVNIFNQDNAYKVIGWDREDIDITDQELITKKIEDISPDVIINAVAYNAVDRCEEDEDEFKQAKMLNGNAVGYLAEAALENDCLFVHYSSDYVFDGQNKEGYKEDDQPNPINNYGKSKLLGEKEIISKSGKGIKWYLIRTSKLFGPKGLSEGAKPSFFDLILDLSKKKKEFKMVHNEEISLFTYTLDLAKVTKELIEGGYGYGIYHIANSEPASWYDGAKYLFEIKNINDIDLTPSKMEDYPRPARRPKYSILINTKFKQLRSWKEALNEYLRNI